MIGREESDHERAFVFHWRALAPDAPDYEREFHFHPTRKWRFDFAWPASMIAVEVDGGRWKAGGGKHASAEDYWKLASAAALGWKVLRFNGEMLTSDPAQCVELVLAALAYGKESQLEDKLL